MPLQPIGVLVRRAGDAVEQVRGVQRGFLGGQAWADGEEFEVGGGQGAKGIGVGLGWACLEGCVALEIARRPRGASRAEPGPTFVSGKLCLLDHLDRLGGPTTNLQ